jgi:hypothetical protein
MTTELANGRPESVTEHGITLELSFPEAQALKAWLLKPAGDGGAALDHEHVKPTLLKLGAALDYVEGVAAVRHELEQAGLAVERLSDEQVADLGRRIAETPLRRGHARP